MFATFKKIAAHITSASEALAAANASLASANATLDRLAKERAEDKALADARAKRFEEQLAAIAKKIAEVTQMWGDFSRIEGKKLEENIADTLAKTLMLGEVELIDIHPNMQSRAHRCQFDIIGVNGAVIMVIEVKRTLRAADALKFAETRLARFQRAFPGLAEGKSVQGVIIYEAAEETGNPEQTAAAAGLRLFKVGEDKTLRETTPKT